MAPTEAKSVILKVNVDDGHPGPEHFEIKTSPASTADDIPAGGILLQCLVFSADPYLRNSVKSTGKKPGATMEGFVAGKVLESKSDKWKAGDLLGASLPFTTVQVVTAEAMGKTAIWSLTEHIKEDQISLGVGVLGMPGATAWAGLCDILRPSKGKGEVLFVSAATGAVGSLVGQIGKHVYGCKTIASVGGPDKGKLAKEVFDYDEVIDYKQASSTEELMQLLKGVAPEGIDMYFENVGGMHFETAVNSLRPGGRIAVCGSISTYSDAKPKPCSIQPMQLIYTQQRIEGFVCGAWLTGQKGTAMADMSRWWKEGKLQIKETHHEGVEKWPEAFQSLFTGANVGKVVVRCS